MSCRLIGTYGTLDLDDDVLAGVDSLACSWESDHGTLGKCRDDEEGDGDEELHFDRLSRSFLGEEGIC
jgi:hypothetical protein